MDLFRCSKMSQNDGSKVINLIIYFVQALKSSAVRYCYLLYSNARILNRPKNLPSTQTMWPDLGPIILKNVLAVVTRL
jgi:hypothetical protein